MDEQSIVSRVPWGLEPSLKEKTDELGVDFDRFIKGLKSNKSDKVMAQEFNVSQKVISSLREHFVHLGIQSIIGRD